MATNLQFIKQVVGTDVASLEMTDIFSADYNVYQIHFVGAEVSNDDYVYFRVINASGTDTGSNYDNADLLMYAHTSFGEVKSKSTTTANYLGYLYPANYDDGIGVTMTVYNPFDSSSYTFFNAQFSSFANGVGLYGGKAIMSHKVAEQITGISVQRVGTYKKIIANVYGVK
tara:strand:- start:498 stop:1010 length:513 start_codon:yes stop_codon:yes gene_type:complete